jgi:hypothetical protein
VKLTNAQRIDYLIIRVPSSSHSIDPSTGFFICNLLRMVPEQYFCQPQNYVSLILPFVLHYFFPANGQRIRKNWRSASPIARAYAQTV